MLRTEQPFSVVLLDWVEIMVAEVCDTTCTTCDIMLSTLCLHKKIVGSDIEGTFIYKILSSHPFMVRCLFRLHICSPSQQLRQWVQQKRVHIRKTTLIKELGKCVTAAQAVQLNFLGIGIQDLVQLRDCNSQEDFVTALREGVRSRDYSHTLRKPPLASFAVVVPPATR